MIFFVFRDLLERLFSIGSGMSFVSELRDAPRANLSRELGFNIEIAEVAE
jgi:hypothetical protein